MQIWWPTRHPPKVKMNNFPPWKCKTHFFQLYAAGSLKKCVRCINGSCNQFPMSKQPKAFVTLHTKKLTLHFNIPNGENPSNDQNFIFIFLCLQASLKIIFCWMLNIFFQIGLDSQFCTLKISKSRSVFTSVANLDWLIRLGEKSASIFLSW